MDFMDERFNDAQKHVDETLKLSDEIILHIHGQVMKSLPKSSLEKRNINKWTRVFVVSLAVVAAFILAIPHLKQFLPNQTTPLEPAKVDSHTTLNLPQAVPYITPFDYGKLRLTSVKFVGGSQIWAWGYDVTQRGRLTLLVSTDEGNSWNQVAGLPDGAPGMFPGGGGLPFEQVAAGTFLDEKTGCLAWVKDGTMTTVFVQDSGHILFTAQSVVPVSADTVQSLNFVTSTDGYALLTGKRDSRGVEKFLLKTSDAGQHWSLVASSLSGQLPKEGSSVSLAFAAGGSGWLAVEPQSSSIPTLYRTLNAGKVWSQVQLPVGSATQRPPTVTSILIPVSDGKGNLTTVASFNGVTGEYGVTYHSSDNGENWTPLVSDMLYPAATNPVPLLVDFVTPSIGSAARGFLMFKTIDGGKDWNVMPGKSLNKALQNFAGPISQVHFENEKQGYIVLDGNDYSRMILITADGGQTWTQLR